MKTTILKISVIFLFMSLIVAGSCEKDEEPQLPPITQTGAGTFGCLVNGDIWLPESTISFPAYPKVSAQLNRSNGNRIWVFGASQGTSSSFNFAYTKPL
jgi:hypothetical protein